MSRIWSGSMVMPLIIAAACASSSSAPPGAPSAARTAPDAIDAVDVVELSATDALARMAAGTLTSRALVAAYLERIARVDPLLRSVVELNPHALAEADALDRERAAGRLRGPLHGLPVLVKDNIAVAGMVNSAGSLALADHRPTRDAFLIARLTAAGAIILGKNNLSEWANFRSTRSTSGWSSRGGQTRNPYALDRSPCGSSSGTGAAIAASLAALGVGTETDGSILCPASVTALVGLKPTVGLVSRDGIIPLAISQDTAGPMTRTVADAALLMNALAAVDERDPAGPAARDRIAGDYRALLDPRALAGKRIGVLRQAMGFHPDVDRATEHAITVIEGLGARASDVALPDWGAWEDPELRVLLAEFKAGINAFLATTGAPPRTLAELIAYNDAHAAAVMPFFGQELFLRAEAQPPPDDPTIRAARAAAYRATAADGLDALFEGGDRLDALIAPTSSPAWVIDPLLGDHYVGGTTSIAAIAGTPSITVPLAMSHGLPFGLMFLGRAYDEARLLAFAFAFEQATSAREPPRFMPSRCDMK